MKADPAAAARLAPVAGLPMYDLAELRGAHETFWAAIAKRLRAAGIDDAPGTLVWGRNVDDLWSDPELLFSQCCGFDLVGAHAARLRPIATPRYRAPGCAGSDYASLVVVAADSDAAALADLRGRVCAINGRGSHSGMNALRALVAPLSENGRFFSAVIESGGHLASLALVASGRADVAAIDCVTHALLARHRPAALAGTRVLCRTAPAPALPFVTRAGIDDETVAILRAALREAVEDDADAALAAARSDLLLEGIEVLPADAYARIAAFEAEARALGYPEIA